MIPNPTINSLPYKSKFWISGVVFIFMFIPFFIFRAIIISQGIFALIVFSSNLTANIASLILSLGSFVGLYFGVKYVIRRSNINPEEILKICLLTCSLWALFNIVELWMSGYLTEIIYFTKSAMGFYVPNHLGDDAYILHNLLTTLTLHTLILVIYFFAIWYSLKRVIRTSTLQ